MEDTHKTCVKCNVEKPVDSFLIRNKKTGTRRRECKDCRGLYQKQLRFENIETYAERDRIYHENNREHRNQKSIEYREDNHDELIIKGKIYYDENREEILERKKIYHELNKNNPQYILKKTLRSRLWYAFKDNAKTGSAIDDMGCSIDFLSEWFEFIFLNYQLQNIQYNWDNKGDFWDIDHVIPLSKFDMADRDQFLISSHWTNLVPLESTINREKYNKISMPHINKQKFLLKKFLMLKNNDTPLKFLEFFKLNANDIYKKDRKLVFCQILDTINRVLASQIRRLRFVKFDLPLGSIVIDVNDIVKEYNIRLALKNLNNLQI